MEKKWLRGQGQDRRVGKDAVLNVFGKWTDKVLTPYVGHVGNQRSCPVPLLHIHVLPSRSSFTFQSHVTDVHSLLCSTPLVWSSGHKHTVFCLTDILLYHLVYCSKIVYHTASHDATFASCCCFSLCPLPHYICFQRYVSTRNGCMIICHLWFTMLYTVCSMNIIIINSFNADFLFVFNVSTRRYFRAVYPQVDSFRNFVLCNVNF